MTPQASLKPEVVRHGRCVESTQNKTPGASCSATPNRLKLESQDALPLRAGDVRQRAVSLITLQPYASRH